MLSLVSAKHRAPVNAIVLGTVISLAVMLGLARSRNHRLNIVSHVIIPVLGIAAFGPAWCAGAGVKIAGISWISPLPPPLSYMGPAVAIWMVLGLAYLVYLYIADRQRVIDVGLLHLDGTELEPAAAP